MAQSKQKPKPVMAKKARKVITPKTKAATAPKVAQTNAHVDAGINVSRYEGASEFVNANRKTKVMLGRDVAIGKVTTRAQSGFYALRECYKDGTFSPRGFDNGILRDLLGAGLITLSGGQKQTIDGKEYLLDAAKPVIAKITAAGMAYGKAA